MAGIGEAPVAEMVDGAKTMIRIYANLENGSWTLFVVSGDRACLRAAGDQYTRFPRNLGRGS